tara:strand:- start:25271 stop:26047 length:777 start_codon:yes stop_codon:yes gene_type:complete
MEEKIIIAEQFLSHQGEGTSQGRLSLFLRLSSCNLLCGNPNIKNLPKDWKQSDLVRDKNATWLCDSIEVFTKQKTPYTYKELIRKWEEEGWLKKMLEGGSITLTGGEPLLRQNVLVGFLNQLHKDYGNVYIEVETNTTIKPTIEFDMEVNQYTCSPKLTNSGMSLGRRYKEDVIKWFIHNPKSIFKFVVANEIDIQEVMVDYVSVFNIPKKKVYLMPAASDLDELESKQRWLIERCLDEGFNYSNRMQIQVYNFCTGV